MSLNIFQEVNQLTRAKAKSHAKLLVILSCSLSAFFTFSFYATGVVYHDPVYKDMPMYLAVPLLAVGVFNAVSVISITILFMKSFGEYSVPRVVDGYWNIASKFILRERFKKNTAEGIWDYVKLHRKYDPLYQADLENLQSQITENKQETNQLKLRVSQVELENTQLRLENEKLKRKSKIDDLARKKLRSLKHQAERQRDEERTLNVKLTNLIRKLLVTIFKLEQIIKKLKGE